MSSQTVANHADVDQATSGFDTRSDPARVKSDKERAAVPGIIADRVCAEVEGDVVVFLIGMRINKLWKIWKWLPALMAMPKMLRELEAHPELGMLSSMAQFSLRSPSFVQYWKSPEHLRAYAHGSQHLPAWQAFNRAVGTSGDVGIWHETYVVPPGHLETLYVNMPRHGLGLAGTLFPAKGDRATAAKRLSRVGSKRI
jgi:hypothetical protein